MLISKKPPSFVFFMPNESRPPPSDDFPEVLRIPPDGVPPRILRRQRRQNAVRALPDKYLPRIPKFIYALFLRPQSGRPDTRRNSGPSQLRLRPRPSASGPRHNRDISGRSTFRIPGSASDAPARQNASEFVFVLAFSYLCRRYFRGVPYFQAEIIPIVPDTGNAETGIIIFEHTPFPFF